ncbi:MAG: hypothetical protein U5O16_21715 [Rhodococcus sp. (in: high G+C Gram-positive bacteria)]|uniref:Secreted protein n=1 Tax=Rhodococcus navarretei TaxID=3128981 RepID=A0ABU9D414_9NOCA|nr:hypothetical protein [Rhodococcus sp. (in: high G+C Gram-positive bacteria)]
MRTTLTTALAAAAAIPLTFLAAAPATADAGDITAVFTTTPNPDGSNTVTGTFTATNSNYPTRCAMYDPYDGTYVLNASTNSPREITKTVVDTDVPDGEYTVEWACTLFPPEGFSSYDGTENAVGLGDAEGYRQPSTLIVPTPDTPDIPEPGCTGSVCLPTGSFGF